MPTSCAVASCRNKKASRRPDLIFHRFPPKNEALTQEWVKFCKRKIEINPKTSYICCQHFDESAYERDLRNELLGLPSRRKLKPDAVPTLGGGEEDCPAPVTLPSKHQVQEGKVKKINGHGRNIVSKQDDLKPRSSKNRPSRCLFCYAHASSEKNDLESGSLASNPINVIFILSKVLGIPKDKLEELLMTEGNPEEWIGLCHDCECSVKAIKKTYDELMATTQKFREAQQSLLVMVKESLGQDRGTRRSVHRMKVTDECRQYVAAAPTFNTVPLPETNIFLQSESDRYTSEEQSARDRGPGQDAGIPEAAEIFFIYSTQDEVTSFRPNPNWSRLYATDIDSQPPTPTSESPDFDPPPSPKPTSANPDEFSTDVASEAGVPEPPIKPCFLLCPLCSRFKCRFERSVRFCIHLATCPGVQPEDSETETKVAQLICAECEDFECGTEDKVLYVDHMLSRHKPMTAPPIPLSSRVFECSICSDPQQRFMNFAKFLRHYNFHLNKQFRCFKCDYKCSRTRHLLAHWKKNHSDNGASEAGSSTEPEYVRETLPKVPWWCPDSDCLLRFSSEEDRDTHILSEGHSPLGDRGRGHVCKLGLCEKSYFSEDELHLHQKTMHVAAAVEEPSLKPMQDVYNCDQPDCVETFTSESKYEEHRRRIHHLDLLQCEYCGNEFVLRRALQAHIHHHHKTVKKKKDPLSCDQCPKQFKSRGNLNAHILHVHKKKYAQQCHICSKGITSRTKLQIHLARVHRAVPPRFPCDVEGCDRFFHERKLLAEHKAWHLGQPEFKCGICGKYYYSNLKLKRHMQLHVNKDTKPYQCELCPKRFASNTYLYLHRRQTHFKNMPRKRRQAYRDDERARPTKK